MSPTWEFLYQLGIWFWGGLFILMIVLMWARTVRRYWLTEMNRETKREKDGDANDNDNASTRE